MKIYKKILKFTSDDGTQHLNVTLSNFYIFFKFIYQNKLNCGQQIILSLKFNKLNSSFFIF